VKLAGEELSPASRANPLGYLRDYRHPKLLEKLVSSFGSHAM